MIERYSTNGELDIKKISADIKCNASRRGTLAAFVIQLDMKEPKIHETIKDIFQKDYETQDDIFKEFFEIHQERYMRWCSIYKITPSDDFRK